MVATVLLIAVASYALPQGGIRAALRQNARQRETHKPNTAVPDRYFTQRLDHYDASLRNASFQQRYFENSTWYKNGGPVFLCVGGEGPALDATVVSRSVHCSDATELAPSVGALIVVLEHRYYGKSVPESPVTRPSRTSRCSTNTLVRSLSSHRPQNGSRLGAATPG